MNNRIPLVPLTGLLILGAAYILLSGPSQIATKAKKFTVQINGENTGSGTIIERNQDKYTVLTSWHVVKYPGEYSITTVDKKKHKIAKIKNLPDVDLALVEFTGKSKNNQPYQVAEFGDSKTITSGDHLYLAGYFNPYSNRLSYLNRDLDKTKRNYLLQTARTLSLQSLAEEGYRIVHDHKLIPGTSGGAIVDHQARIIGINGIRTKEETSEQDFGIGIPLQIYQAGKDKFVNVASYKDKKAQKKQPDVAEDVPKREKDSALPTTSDVQQDNLTTKYREFYASPAGHFGDVNAVAIKGDLIVTGSEDKTLKVWNRDTGEPPKTLIGHTAAITAVEITDKYIISSSQDSTIKFWNRATGELQNTLKGHTAAVDAIALSKDGTILVSGSGDDTIKVWDLTNKKLLKTLNGHTAPVYSVAISDNNQIIVSGSEDKTIKIWDLSSAKSSQTLKPIKTLIDQELSSQLTRKAIRKQAKSKKPKPVKPVRVSHEASVDSLVISNQNSKDEEFIISGSSDNLIKVWDLKTGELKRTLKGHNSSVRDLAIAGNILVSAESNYETVKVWNFRSGDLKRSFTGDNYFWFSSIAISEDGTILVSASQDETIKIRDLTTGRLQKIADPFTGRLRHPLIANKHSIRTLIVSDNHIINASRNNTITVRNLETGALEQLLKGHNSEVNSLAVSGNTLVSGSQDRTIRIWNLTTGKLERTIRNYFDPIPRSIAISEDGNKLVTGSYRTIKIWDLATGKLEKLLHSHNDGVNAIAIQGDTIVSGGGDKTIEVRSLATGELEYILPLKEDREQEKGHKASINSIAVSNNKIYSASYDKTIKVWNLETGKLEKTFTDHAAAVNSLAISDSILVSGSRDGVIETRNLNTEKLEDIIQAHPTSVNTVAISGSTIVSGSSDNTIKIWNRSENENPSPDFKAKNFSLDRKN